MADSVKKPDESNPPAKKERTAPKYYKTWHDLVPKGWKPWYEHVLAMRINGMSIAAIAKSLKRSEQQVNLITKSPQFHKKMDLLLSAHGVAMEDLLGKYKTTLLYEKLKIALNCKLPSVKNTALDWLLERFPEFKTAPQNIMQVANYSPPKEEYHIDNLAAEQLAQIAETLAKGNPFVEGEGGKGANRLTQLGLNEPNDPKDPSGTP